MHPINSLAITYLLFTLTSSGIIYGAFRKNLDNSAKYFLIAELFMATTAAIIFTQNHSPDLYTSELLAAGNFFSVGSEIAVLFSIQSLVKNLAFRRYIFSLFALAIYVVLVEIIRHYFGSKIIVLIHNIVITSISLSIFISCQFKKDALLANNQFIKAFRWFEFGLIIFAVVRGLGYFANTMIVPRDNPQPFVIILFAIYVAMSVFRYMSYIGLRITWVDPRTWSKNPFNRDLAKAIEEKDHLLRGLIASNRVIGISALASSLAHQLSQPLTAISLQADRSRREIAKSIDNPLLVSSLDEISVQSGKLAELVQNLRQLFSSRNYEFHSFSLHKACVEILEVVEPTLQSKKIALIQNLEADPQAYGDSIQIQQVLINVFNNAIDVMSNSNSQAKEIRLTITQNEKMAILRVQDTGTGIDATLLPSIFELYKTTKQGGLGVGLWLSKTIMERHQGSITASNGADGGAVFEIQIPLAKSIS
jgi:signal transduction histidine kinase